MKMFFKIVLVPSAVFILSGCGSTKESTVKETTVTVKDISIPVTPVADSFDIPFDTTSESYNQVHVTPHGDSVLIKITEKPVKNSKPVLHAELKVIPAPVPYRDTTVTIGINKQVIIEQTPWQKFLSFITGTFSLLGMSVIVAIIILWKCRKFLLK